MTGGPEGSEALGFRESSSQVLEGQPQLLPTTRPLETQVRFELVGPGAQAPEGLLSVTPPLLSLAECVS